MNLREAAQAVVDIMKDHVWYWESDKAAFTALVDALAEPEWIPVSERLPEPHTDVLVVIPPPPLAPLSTRVCLGYLAGGEWHPIHDISHWRPLPAPPAEE